MHMCAYVWHLYTVGIFTLVLNPVVPTHILGCRIGKFSLGRANDLSPITHHKL